MNEIDLLLGPIPLLKFDNASGGGIEYKGKMYLKNTVFVSEPDRERLVLEEHAAKERSCWSSRKEEELFCDFLRKAWAFDTDKRPTGVDFLKHGWLTFDEDVEAGRIIITKAQKIHDPACDLQCRECWPDLGK